MSSPDMTRQRLLFCLSLSLCMVALTGCAVLDVKADGRLRSREGWVLLPVLNQGETRRAGERVEELLATLLRSEKNIEVASYPPTLRASKSAEEEPESDERLRYEKSLAWARAQKLSYGVGGSVQEWGYRSGTDGEPAVGLSIRVIDLQSGRVVYTASGASSPLAYGSVGGAAQKLLRALLDKLAVN